MANNITTKEIEPSSVEPLTSSGLFASHEMAKMPIGMRIMFDPQSRSFFEGMAASMASPSNRGLPKHLKGDEQLCFAIIRRAINWKLDPYEVAACTYNVGGNIGYYGKLVRAIILSSGLVSNIQFEYGPSDDAWLAVEGKFEVRRSSKTDANGESAKYMVPAYNAKDEQGLYCIAHAISPNGEVIGSTDKVYLSSCHPRNSTVWAYSPRKQIREVLTRQLGDLVCPHVMFGAHFDVGLDRTAIDGGFLDTDDAPNYDGPVEEVTPEIVEDDQEVQEAPKPVGPSPKKAAAGEKKKSPGRPKGVKINFREKELTKPAMTKEITYLVGKCPSIQDLVTLHLEVTKSLSDDDEGKALLAELTPIFTKQREKIQSLSDAQDDGGTEEHDHQPVLAGDDEDEEFNI